LTAFIQHEICRSPRRSNIGNSRSLLALRSSSALSTGKTLEAILFDCDGVLVDTERDGHRLAFNRAFKLNGIDEEWSEQRYGKLLEVGGGKVSPCGCIVRIQ
jgi:hypothetical protein